MTQLLLRCCAFFGAFVLLISTNQVRAGVNNPTKADQKTIHVGIYAPFTNKSAYIGRNMLGAMELARDQLKPSAINYEFYTLDTLQKNVNQTKMIQKFIDVHQIDVIVTEGADMGAVVAPLAKKNKLIHFFLGAGAEMTDGANNFQTHSPTHKRGAILTTAIKPEFVAQFKQEYFSHPVTEAGYAYDIFNLINKSAEVAIRTHADFTNQTLATNILAFESGMGLMGKFSVDKKGVLYQQETRTV